MGGFRNSVHIHVNIVDDTHECETGPIERLPKGHQVNAMRLDIF